MNLPRVLKALESLWISGLSEFEKDKELIKFLEGTFCVDSKPNVSVVEAEEILSSFFSLPSEEQMDSVQRKNRVGELIEAFCEEVERSSVKLSSQSGKVGGEVSGGGALFSPPLHLQGTIDSLLSLFPELDAEAVCEALQRSGSEDVERVATYLLEGDHAVQVAGEARLKSELRAAAVREAALAAAEDARREEASRRAVKQRCEEREELDAGKTHKPRVPELEGPSEKKGATVKRYVEGSVVFLRPGEKFLVEKPTGPDPYAVSLKVKKKGQGGASPGFKK